MSRGADTKARTLGARGGALERGHGAPLEPLAQLRDALGGVPEVHAPEAICLLSRVAVFDVGAGTPWKQVWTQTKGNIVSDVEFSADGSVIACVTMGVHQVDIHDARTGALRARIPFGVTATNAPQSKWSCTLRFSKELLVVSGGFGTADEKTVRHS